MFTQAHRNKKLISEVSWIEVQVIKSVIIKQIPSVHLLEETRFLDDCIEVIEKDTPSVTKADRTTQLLQIRTFLTQYAKEKGFNLQEAISVNLRRRLLKRHLRQAVDTLVQMDVELNTISSDRELDEFVQRMLTVLKS